MLKILLYPGIIIHELMHLIICILIGVKVRGFKLGIRESHVKHSNTTAINIFLISIAPFIFGNLLAISLIYFSFTTFTKEYIVQFIINWVVVATIYYSIPSDRDMRNIKESMNSYLSDLWNGSILQKLFILLYTPFIYLPLYTLMLVLNAFDNYEPLRLLLIIFIYIAVFLII